MYDEDYRDDEPEAPPEVEYADLQRRFLMTAAGWVVIVGLLYVLGYLELGIAIVVAVSGGLSALAVAGYWTMKLRELNR